MSVCLSVGYNREPYRNGQTDEGAVWVVDLGELEESCIR